MRNVIVGGVLASMATFGFSGIDALSPTDAQAANWHQFGL